MTEEIAVYKLQEWDMGNGEKKYSQLGSLEAHYYFAKNNGGKVLFTTKSAFFKINLTKILLLLDFYFVLKCWFFNLLPFLLPL